MDKEKAVVLLSGGIDSTAALAHTLQDKEALALWIAYGQKQVEQEKEAAFAIAEHYEVPLMDVWLPEHLFRAIGVHLLVPFRNGMLLSLATAVAQEEGFPWVVAGMYSQPGWGYEYPDSTPEFLGTFGAVMQMGTEGRVRLLTPWSGWTKDKVVRWAATHNVPLDLTWTCYNPQQGKRCGKCPACEKRAWAMEQADVLDN